ncbi:MAG: hypothetical protein GC145_12960 [Caulobacter sp.]|nr:hypothetical protein [Caulobacter sp.]
MRIVTLAAIAAVTALPFAASATAAAAAEPTVTVTYGDRLDKKIDTYGRREVDRLADGLRLEVQKRVSGLPALQDAEIVLVLEDVVANRPTMKQMSETPGLSYESFGTGGAAVAGEVITADGVRHPLSYKWYETDIRWAWSASTWRDAEQAIDRFAVRLARDYGGDGA